jgi:hypothetical protein
LSDYNGPPIIVGNTFTASVVFTNSGTATDPDTGTIEMLLTNPNGVETKSVYGLDDNATIRDSAGNYHHDVNCDIAGYWVAYFHGQFGPKEAADEIRWFVGPSRGGSAP